MSIIQTFRNLVIANTVLNEDSKAALNDLLRAIDSDLDTVNYGPSSDVMEAEASFNKALLTENVMEEDTDEVENDLDDVEFDDDPLITEVTDDDIDDAIDAEEDEDDDEEIAFVIDDADSDDTADTDDEESADETTIENIESEEDEEEDDDKE